MTTQTASTIEAYLDGMPPQTAAMLRQIIEIIEKTAPEAEPGISYGMPAYKLQGLPLLYIGGYRKHVACYPVPPGTSKFQNEASKFRYGKSTVRFVLSEPLPAAFIKQLIQFRVAETRTRASAGKQAAPASKKIKAR